MTACLKMGMKLLGAAAFCAALTANAQKTVSVQVLAINDFHGNLEPPSGANGEINRTPAGGVEYLATHLANARKQNPNTIVVGAGDIFGASPLISALFEEEPSIQAMNALGLDITALGNHELDHGVTGLKTRLKDAHFTYLAANMERSGQHVFAPTAIRTVGGVKIGFIGEILDTAPKVISASMIKGLTFEDEARIANEAAARLEKQGVHTIILLTHEGGFQHSPANAPRKPLDPNGCENFSGEIADVANKLSPAIKVVISGHTHVFYNCTIGGHIVTSASSFGRMFTRFDLTVDRKTDRLVDVAARNEIVTRDVPKDPAETAIIAQWKPKAQEVADRPAGSITATISKHDNAAGESQMGDLLADAQLAATSSPAEGGAQIAFMNSGGIRAELAKPAGDSGPYSVRFNDLYTVQPFHNQLTVRTMTGDMLRRVLEQQFGPQGDAHIFQVSRGFHYAYKAKAAQGEHIVPGSISLNGKPIAPTDKFRVEASDFMAAGSENLTVFREGTDVVAGPVDVDAFTAYMKAHSPVSPPAQDRIERVD